MKWGIMSTGNIAHPFADALKLAGQTLTAVSWMRSGLPGAVKIKKGIPLIPVKQERPAFLLLQYVGLYRAAGIILQPLPDAL